MGLLDSHITSNRARAERAYQNTSAATNVNPEYVTNQVNQKPKDYESGTGVALGAYPVGDGLVQRVSWNDNTETWENLGDPILTQPYSPRSVENISDLNNISTQKTRMVAVEGPTVQSGMFLPFETDPIGDGDDGSTVLQSSNGKWWVRRDTQIRGIVNVKWFGAKDSEDITTELKNALDKALTTNGVCYLPSGNYKYSSTIEIPDGVVLVGDGKEKTKLTLKDGSSSNLTAYSTSNIKGGTHDIYPHFTTEQGIGGSQNIKIKDLQIQGNTSGTSGVRSEAGLWINDAENVIIEDCRIEDVRDDLSSTDIVDQYRSFCVCITDSSKVTVKGGNYNRAGYEVIGIRGNTKDSVIKNIKSTQVTTSNGRHTIQVSDVPQPERIKIDNNVLIGGGSRIINDSSLHITISNNIIKNSVNAAIEVLTIDTSSSGGSNNSAKDTSIVNNTIEDGGLEGIRVGSIDTSNNLPTEEVNISNNQIEAESQGIFITDTIDAVINGNRILSKEGNGIRVRDDNLSKTTRINIRENIITSNDTSNNNGEGAAVSIGPSRNIDVVGNHQKFGRIGVFVENGVDRMLIADNDVTEAQNTGLDIDGGATNINQRDNRT